MARPKSTAAKPAKAAAAKPAKVAKTIVAGEAGQTKGQTPPVVPAVDPTLPAPIVAATGLPAGHVHAVALDSFYSDQHKAVAKGQTISGPEFQIKEYANAGLVEVAPAGAKTKVVATKALTGAPANKAVAATETKGA